MYVLTHSVSHNMHARTYTERTHIYRENPYYYYILNKKRLKVRKSEINNNWKKKNTKQNYKNKKIISEATKNSIKIKLNSARGNKPQWQQEQNKRQLPTAAY